MYGVLQIFLEKCSESVRCLKGRFNHVSFGFNVEGVFEDIISRDVLNYDFVFNGNLKICDIYIVSD